MKVFVIAWSTEPLSGWGRITLETLTQFKSFGVSYILATEHISANFPEAYQLLPSNSLGNILKNLVLVRKLGREAAVVHAMDIWPFGLYALAACWWRPSRMYMNGIGTYSVAPLYFFIRRQLVRLMVWRSAKIFCISRYTLNEIEKKVPLGDKGAIVHLGSTDLPEPSAVAVRRIQVLTEGSFPIILTVGGVDKEGRKGQLNTAEAIKILKEKYPNILYLIVGSMGNASYAKRILEFAATQDLRENIRILDSVKTDDELAALYRRCDIFALNSNTDHKTHHFEGFGLVFLEAYQFGKPVVGSKDCGIEDVIANGVTGYLTRQADPTDIAEKIETILDHPDAFSLQNILNWREQFNWQRTVQTYIMYYKQS